MIAKGERGKNVIDVYGLGNCDTCRKALKWLTENNLEHRFHNFRRDGLDRQKLGRWIGAGGLETLLNRCSTTWCGLADTDKDAIDGDKAAALMAARTARGTRAAAARIASRSSGPGTRQAWPLVRVSGARRTATR